MELPQLQTLIGKNADAYRADFQAQYAHFLTEQAIFRLDPAQPSKRFTNLVNFITSVGHHYKDDVAPFPGEIIG